MITPKFAGFKDREDVARQFEEGVGERWNDKMPYKPAVGFPTKREILYAVYEAGGYDGAAFVLYKRDGKLFEVHASHCSCYGLENQWKPEETTWAALAIRQEGIYGAPGPVLAEAKRRTKVVLRRGK